MKTRVLVVIEGGIVQYIQADKQHVDVLVLDHDTDGADADRIGPDGDGNEVYFVNTETHYAPVDVAKAFAALDAYEKREGL